MAKTAKRSVNIYVNGKEVENSLSNIRKAIREQEAEWKKMTQGTQEYIDKAKEIQRLKDLLVEHNKVLETSSERTERLRNRFLMLGAGLGGFTQVLTTFKNGIDYLREFATELAKLDDKMHMVRKTTGLTIRQIQDLNREFMKIDTRTSREELNDLAYAAGKLGIDSKEGVLQFVKAADEINVALGDVLGGTDAIVEISKMTSVFKKSTEEIASGNLQEQLVKTGSVLNELGKTSTANEKNMANFLGRISGFASQVGMSLDQAAGYASVFDQKMQKVEMSATALQRMMQEMIKKPGEFAKAANMSLEEFNKLLGSDFNEAVIKVLEGFSKAGGMEALVPAFKEMGLDGQRATSAIAALASSIDELRAAQTTANTALKEGTSTGEEYRTMNESMQAQVEKAQKAVQDARIELGEKMYPVMIKFMGIRSSIIKWLASLKDKTMNLFAAGTILSAFVIQKAIPRIKNLIVNVKNSEVAVTLHTLAKKKEIIATNEQIIADQKLEIQRLKGIQLMQKSLVAMTHDEFWKKQLTATTKALALAEQELAAAEKQVASAKSVTALSVLKQGWFAILTILLSVTTALHNYIKEANKVNVMRSEMRNEINKERKEINQLFNAYKNLRVESKERAKILQIIKDKYSPYLKNLIDEKGNLLDIAAAQRLVNKEKQNEIRLKYKQEADEDTYNKHKKKISKNIEAIFKYIGENEAGMQIIEDYIYEALSNDVNYEYNPELIGTDRNLKIDLKKVGVSEDKLNYYNSFNNLIATYYKNLRDQEKELQRNEKKFGVSMSETFQDVRDEIDQTEETFNNMGEGADKAAQKIADKWKALMERISDLNRKYSIKEGPMSKAKQKLMQEYGEMKDAIQDFVKENEGYTKKGNDEIVKLDKEMWKQIKRLDEEERIKFLQKIEDRVKTVSERIETFRLKQRRKSQSQLTTDLEEIAKDWGKLQKSITEEGQKLIDKQSAGKIVSDIFEGTLNEGSKEWEGYIEWLEKYGITLKEIQKYKDQKVTKEGILELFGISLTQEEEKTLEKLNELLKNITQAGREESEARIAENIEELMRSYESAGLKAYNEAIKKADRDIGDIETTIKYYKGLNAEGNQKENIEKLLENLRQYREKLLQDKETLNKRAHGKGAKIWDLFGISEEDWADWEYNWQDNLEKIASTVEEWADQIISMMSYIHEAEDNAIEAQLKKWEKIYDSRADQYRKMLENNIISQKYYDAQMEKLEKEKEERENSIKRRSWEKEKRANLASAIINGIAAAISSFKNAGGFPMGLITMALSLGVTTAQIASISSQVNPYARGGYIKGMQMILAGEQGDEWVASNKLLKDRKTAPVIEALQSYQNGDRKALEKLSKNMPNTENLSSAAKNISSTFASEKQPQSIIYQMQNGEEMKEMLVMVKELKKYLEDPRNRQAYITRKMQLEYEQMEERIKKEARL